MNSTLLMEAIRDSGVTHKFLAKKLGITPNSFSRKLYGRCEFKASELIIISDVLRLSLAQKDEIFLGV